MTKPIEGWVAIGEDGVVVNALLNEDFATGRVINGGMPQYYVEVLLGLPESALGLVFRKVKITFTDEQEEKSHLPPNITSISEFNAMPEADKEAYFDSVFGPYSEVSKIYDLLMEAKENCMAELVGVVADRPKKEGK